MNGGPDAEGNILDLDGLRALAEDVVASAAPRAVVWLSGDLGSGKTAFVQAAVQAAGASDVTSPTYALVHEYHARIGTVYHVDCYRIDDPADAIDVDFPELQKTGALLFIEWPERVGNRAPAPDVHLHFSHVGDPERRLVQRLS